MKNKVPRKAILKKTKRIETDLIKRISTFLPLLLAANKDLDEKAKHSNVDIEKVEAGKEHIEMNLDLGVFDVGLKEIAISLDKKAVSMIDLNSTLNTVPSDIPVIDFQEGQSSLPNPLLSHCLDESVSPCPSTSLSSLRCRKSPLLPKDMSTVSDSAPSLLREALCEAGWVPFQEGTDRSWNLQWKGSRFTKVEFSSCMPYQRMNHFPLTNIITQKENLYRFLRKLQAIYPSLYQFFPESYCVPNEYKKFMRRMQTQIDLDKEKTCWIAKPADLSRGRGIYIFKNLHELIYDSNTIVQTYIERPLLISGYKFDIRCYVLVRSYDPLSVFLYEEGLARFATQPYELDSFDNSYIHLTNTSINKFSPFIEDDKKDVGPGCKWDLRQLREYLTAIGINFHKIWNEIIACTLLTLLPMAKEIPKSSTGCFELYGFDFLIDEMMKVWLLEINLSPAMSVDSEALLTDLLLVLDLSSSDGEKAASGKHLQKAQTPLWLPKRCGKFQKIYPDEQNLATSTQQNRTQLKDNLQDIKETYLARNS